MELVVISAEKYLDMGMMNDTESIVINRLFESGLSVLHLRKPGTDLFNYRKLLSNISTEFHPYIALHQFHELKEDFDIKRLHFGEEQRKVNEHRFQNNYCYSTSVHRKSDLIELRGFEYAFLSPVFDSISKPGYSAMYDARLDPRLKPSGTKVFALGGISEHNIHEIENLGFDGAALMGSVWNRADRAVEVFKKIKAIC